MAQYFLALADTFTGLKAKETLFTTANSDHASFWKYGFLAIRGRYHDRTPKYHTTGDTIGPFHFVNCGTNNLPMYTEVVKATVATVARLAGARQVVGAAETPLRDAPVLACRPTVSPGLFYVDASQGTRIDVCDAAGRVLRRLTPPASRTALDMRGNPPGVYLARMRLGGETQLFRLTVAR
jgi:hypothetical protein